MTDDVPTIDTLAEFAEGGGRGIDIIDGATDGMDAIEDRFPDSGEPSTRMPVPVMEGGGVPAAKGKVSVGGRGPVPD
eukprot:CAMPEP_0195008848 /NCGR_PEP_ID=MMETSP0326_2-20130528/8801_1 /TAXON_ID=2866 ORGANISM="Crypthecodinium cohnii, Strain Seligo" /NCGR_SAMPLE_ID=MMETSP0326_2 /ASSEMBLY_ACC=CAM_ASM_000348 /LENGTH=76 /DNA_ID=CAMNT_0040016819 /DNA_START=560 /DNA_END=790 /DNA_ORIENTATION=+